LTLNSNNSPSTEIFQFTDPGLYLKTWRTSIKAKNKLISHEYLCRKLGVKNRSYFSDLEAGRRQIGPDIFNRLVNLLKLNKEESSYFRAIIGFSQSPPGPDRDYWFEQMIALNHTPYKIAESNVYEYFSNSQHAMIRALLDIYPIQANLLKALELLVDPISEVELNKSIKLLLDLGLISQDNEGKYFSTDKILSTKDSAKSILLNRYQLSLVRELEQNLVKSGTKNCSSNTLTLSLSKAGFFRVKKRLERIRKEVLAIAYKDTDPAEHVYQLHIHLLGKTIGSIDPN
jgi:uncharacterized protein (TIGR02147 family)